jgi:hypothetical protein
MGLNCSFKQKHHNAQVQRGARNVSIFGLPHLFKKDTGHLKVAQLKMPNQLTLAAATWCNLKGGLYKAMLFRKRQQKKAFLR